MRFLTAFAAGLLSAFVLTSASYAAPKNAAMAAAYAKAAQNTKYKSYPISGDTAGEVLVSMIRRGPSVGGVKAYATTLADFRQTGTMLGNGRSCRVRNFEFDGIFTITLPKLRNERALIGGSRVAWNQFLSFLKQHEEKHRTIWVGCSTDFEAKVRQLSAKTCNGVEAKAKKLWERVRRDCRKLHDAHDIRDQNALLNQPLVRLAIGSNAVVRKRPVSTRPKLRGLPRPSALQAE